MRAESKIILKLEKSLNGLKQSPRCWKLKFNSAIICLGFTRSPHDYCLYVRKRNGNPMYLILYVDDLLISGSSVS